MAVEGGGGGDLSCAGKCYKNLLFAFNVLFLLSGVLAICIGLFVMVFPVSVHVAVLLNNHLYKAAGLILILAGLVVVGMAIFACCGAKRENKYLLAIYVGALVVIFFSEFIAGNLALAVNNQAEIYIGDFTEDSLTFLYGTEGEDEVTAAWDYIQKWFECCGLYGNTTEAAIHYTRTIWYLSSKYRVPKSCCQKRSKVVVNKKLCQDRQSLDWNTYINNEGCIDVILGTAQQYSGVIAGSAIGLSIVQLIGMVLSFCFYHHLAPPAKN